MASPAVVGDEPRRHEVADVLRDNARGLRLTAVQARAVRDIVACRTQRLGGHLEVCRDCGFSRGSYNSCRNRHCPKCQGEKAYLWLERQHDLLLPVPYFMLTFTLPDGLRPVARSHQNLIYDLLFRTSAAATQHLARDPRFIGGPLRVGMVGAVP